MPLNKLKRSFEERKNTLVHKLEHNRDELDLSQQHQIYGAVKEIDNFLRSIDHYRTLEAEKGFNMDLTYEREWPLMKRTQRVFRKLRDGTIEALSWTFVKAPIRINKRVRGTFEEYRERREIERRVREEVERKLREAAKK